jgi:ankyrin repeat protein
MNDVSLTAVAIAPPTPPVPLPLPPPPAATIFIPRTRKFKEPVPTLISAIYCNDIHTVQRLIDDGHEDVDVRDPTWSNSTGLQVAVRVGMVDMVTCLLKRGASISVLTSGGESLLALACTSITKNSERIVRSLLLHGVSVKTKARDGRSALHQAVLMSSTAIIQLLLDNGADIADVDNLGHNALHCAAWRRVSSNAVKCNIVKVLLAHGTDVKVKMDILCAEIYDTSDDEWSDDEDSPRTPAEIADQPRRALMMAALFLNEDKIDDVHAAQRARREIERTARCVAFDMGQHKRLGADSLVSRLSTDAMQLILKHI